jgi:hypothetical protein
MLLGKMTRNRLVRIAKRFVRRKISEMKGEGMSRATENRGLYTLYFQLTESVGLKICRNNDDYDRKAAIEKYKRQLAAYQIGLAPYCFGLFVIDGYVCHLTETVAVAAKYMPYTEDVYKKIRTRVEHLRRVLLKKIGFPFQDDHLGNIGQRSPNRDRILCIDFDM